MKQSVKKTLEELQLINKKIEKLFEQTNGSNEKEKSEQDDFARALHEKLKKEFASLNE